MVEALGWLMESENDDDPVVIAITEFGTVAIRDPNLEGSTWMVHGDSGKFFAEMATDEYEKAGFFLGVHPIRVTLEDDPWPVVGDDQGLIEYQMQPLLNELVAAVGYLLPLMHGASR